jgi:NAD(P)-dependent dehydrogenase (short-subunit alcohol dehydrogenase family)
MSAFYMCRELVPAMQEARRGHLFFMASVASFKGYPTGLAYGVSKHAMLGLARSLREELKPDGIRVTTLMPGATFTPTWDGADIPEERMMPAEDIAAAVVSAYTMSPRTVVEEILLRPQLGDL